MPATPLGSEHVGLRYIPSVPPNKKSEYTSLISRLLVSASDCPQHRHRASEKNPFSLKPPIVPCGFHNKAIAFLTNLTPICFQPHLPASPLISTLQALASGWSFLQVGPLANGNACLPPSLLCPDSSSFKGECKSPAALFIHPNQEK